MPTDSLGILRRLFRKARLLTLPPWRAETRLVPSKAAAPRLTLVSRFTVLGNDARTPLADFINSLLVNQMMVDGIANQFGGGCELQLILETAPIGTDCLDAENERLRDVLERLALGY